MNKKKLYTLMSMTTLITTFVTAISIPVQAATRDFTNIQTQKVYKSADWKADSKVFDALVDELVNNPDNYVVEFSKKEYYYQGLLDRLTTGRQPGETIDDAFANALKSSNLVYTSASTTALTITKVGTFNPILGYLDITVNDSSLAIGAKVDGAAVDATNFQTPNATTVRIFTDKTPTSIVLTTNNGDVIAKGSATTLNVTKVGSYNDILGYLDITVNDSSLIIGVKVDGVALTSDYIQTPNATTVRIFTDEKPTSIVLTTNNGDVVVKGASNTTSTISNIDTIYTTVNQGENYKLPSMVEATMSDGNTKDVAITWDKQVDTSQAGTYTFTGTVTGYSGKVRLSLTVKQALAPVAHVTSVKSSIEVGKTTMIIVTLTNSTDDGKYDISYNGIKLTKLDTGIYSIDVAGNVTQADADAKITFNAVTVATITKVDNISINVNQNDSYTLPSTVKATMSDGSIKDLNVTWDRQVDTSKAGTYTFYGTVDEYSNKVKLTLNVKGTTNQVINFLDKNLEQVVRNTINKPTGDIYKSDVEKITELTAENLTAENNNIQDISGIENLSNLQKLYLTFNQISDISALKGLTNLQELSLGTNQISDISALKGLTNLQTLILGGNQISDISALKGLTNLQELNLASNQISDISALKELTNLQELNLDLNQISDISALKRLTNLQELGLSTNQIKDISVLKGLTNLQRLYLWESQISDISALKGLTNLQGLYLRDNQISDISALKGLTNLQELYLMNNQISDTDKQLLRDTLPKCSISY